MSAEKGFAVPVTTLIDVDVKWLKPKEIAAREGVAYKTVLRWIAADHVRWRRRGSRTLLVAWPLPWRQPYDLTLVSSEQLIPGVDLGPNATARPVFHVAHGENT